MRPICRNATKFEKPLRSPHARSLHQKCCFGGSTAPRETLKVMPPRGQENDSRMSTGMGHVQQKWPQSVFGSKPQTETCTKTNSFAIRKQFQIMFAKLWFKRQLKGTPKQVVLALLGSLLVICSQGASPAPSKHRKQLPRAPVTKTN